MPHAPYAPPGVFMACASLRSQLPPGRLRCSALLNRACLASSSAAGVGDMEQVEQV